MIRLPTPRTRAACLGLALVLTARSARTVGAEAKGTRADWHANAAAFRSEQANLLAEDPVRKGEAVGQYQAILDLPNQAPDFLHRLFRAWCLTGIAQLARDARPDDAERYLRQVLELGVGGDTEAQARRLLSELSAPARR
jgi:hypothetical protein